MRKKFDLIDLDCANCASKMEAAIAEVEGVNFVNINFIMQQITLEIEDGRFNEILKQVVKVCKKIEPDCEIVLD